MLNTAQGWSKWPGLHWKACEGCWLMPRSPKEALGCPALNSGLSHEGLGRWLERIFRGLSCPDPPSSLTLHTSISSHVQKCFVAGVATQGVLSYESTGSGPVTPCVVITREDCLPCSCSRQNTVYPGTESSRPYVSSLNSQRLVF